MFVRRLASDIVYSKCRINLLLFNYARTLPRITNTLNLHLQHQLCAKLFLDLENQHAYNIIAKTATHLPVPNDKSKKEEILNESSFQTLVNEDWSRKSTKDIFDAFPKLGIYCMNNNISITNTIFDAYIDNLTDNLKYASDEELLFIFDSVSKWPPTETVLTRNFIEVWAALDDECLNRYKGWSVDEILNFLSCFFIINLTKSSDFTSRALQKLTNKSKQLTPKQLVQTLFFIGVFRKSPIDMYHLEVRLESLFPEFSADDLAILSMGFFKSKTPIRNLLLVNRIAEVVIEQSNTIHEVSLAALLKVIRYSMRITQDDTIYRLLDRLQYEVPRLSIMCNVHIALLGSTTLVLHKECLNKIAQNLIESMSNTRLKDLERLVLTFGTFNYQPKTSECFFHKVLDELRKPEREKEIQTFGRSFACCIAYLGLFDIYPIDFIKKIMSEDFLLATYGKYFINYGREILTLHNKAQIFGLPVPLLSDKEAVGLAKKYTDFVPRVDYKKQYNFTERMFLEVLTVLKNNRGSDFVIGDHILTHHQRGDVIVCNDKSGKPLPVVDKFKTNNFGLIKFLPDKENDWIVLIIAGRNVMIHNHNVPSGQFDVKVKELRKLGYKAAMVIWTEYSKLTTDEEKLDYLNNYWHEQKYKARKRAMDVRQHVSGTGGGRPRKPLKEPELRIISLIGEVAVFGNEGVRLPFNDLLLPASSSSVELLDAAIVPHSENSPVQQAGTNNGSSAPPLSSPAQPDSEAYEEPAGLSGSAPTARRGGQRLRRRYVQAVTAGPPQWAQDFEERRLQVDIQTSQTFVRIAEALSGIKELLAELVDMTRQRNQ